MNLACPFEPVSSESFQELKNRYKDENIPDSLLTIYLQDYREQEDLPLDWMPSSEDDYRGFTNYIKTPTDESSNKKYDAKYIDSLYKTMTSLYPSPAMLNNRLGRITEWFRNRVSDIAKKDGVSRSEAIRSQAEGTRSGFQVIMDEVFQMIEAGSTVEGQIAWHKSIVKGLSDEVIDGHRDWYEYRADEFKKMLDNKEFLAGLAAPMIGAEEGLSVTMDGITFDFGEVDQTSFAEETEGQDDDNIDTEEASKGDRFVDFRTLSLMSTLSTEAKQLISNILRRDANGQYVYDDLGYALPMDVRQTAIILHRALRTSEPSTMMDDLRAAAIKYPSLKGLIAHLDANEDDKAIVFVNFKKARNTYYYAYRDNRGKLAIASSSNMADGHEFSREAGSNISAGLTSDEPKSVVTANGMLKDLSFFDEKPASLLEGLRGLGFSLTAEDMNTLKSAYPDDTTPLPDGRVFPKQAKEFDALTKAVEDIYDKAKGIIRMNEDLTGSHLYQYAQESFAQIAEILSPIQRGETEERVISKGKSLSSNTNPNALSQMMDILSNARGLSKEDYRKELMKEYGQFEGMSLGFGKYLQMTGWLATVTADWSQADSKLKYQNPEAYKARERQLREQEQYETKFDPKNFRVVSMTDSINTI